MGHDRPSRGWTRRQFLAAVPASVLLASCRRRPYARGDFPVPPRSAVGLFAAPSYDVDLADVVSRGIRELQFDVKGRSILLKPNMVEYAVDHAINTHPLLVAGAATAFLGAGAREVVVGEGPGHRRDVEYLLASTGLGDHLRESKLRFVDLNHDDVRVVRLRSQFTGFGDLALPVEVLKADLVVSMPKLKTHHWAAMTASMKNLFGVVPGAIYGWPKNPLHFHGIENSILDLNATVRPAFTIVDAIVAMEGDGPIMGRARHTGFVAMGTDLVAVDATCARVIGLDPTKIEYLENAAEFLGNLDARRIDHRGEQPARYATEFEVVDAFKGLRLRVGG